MPQRLGQNEGLAENNRLLRLGRHFATQRFALLPLQSRLRSPASPHSGAASGLGSPQGEALKQQATPRAVGSKPT